MLAGYSNQVILRTPWPVHSSAIHKALIIGNEPPPPSAVSQWPDQDAQVVPRHQGLQD